MSLLVLGLSAAALAVGWGHAALAAGDTRLAAVRDIPAATAEPMPAPLPALDPASPSADSVRVPPIEAMTPLADVTFGPGLQLEPALLLADVVGLAALAYVVRRRWMAPLS